jgi:hypothetical protein
VQLFDAVHRERNRPVVQNKPSFAVDGCAANKWTPPAK